MPLLSRRALFQSGSVIIGAYVGLRTDVVGAAPRRTPACDEDGPLTQGQTEGPYFKPASPPRMSFLEDGVEGERLIVEGTVYDGYCKPVLGALIDFWQADGNGSYDNENFQLRGHQYVDGEGRFHLETVIPGYYANRARHIHVKVQAPGHPILTTQLYFPDDSANSHDNLHNSALEVKMSERRGRKVAWFDFVLNVF